MKLWTTILLALFLLPNSSNAQSAINSIEMIANGGGIVSPTIGFDVTPIPSGYDAYSASWYRDVLESPTYPNASIFDLPGGMQDAGGWFFVVGGQFFIDEYDTAVAYWSRDGRRNEFFEGNSYEIRFTTDGGQAQILYSPDPIDVPFEIWYLGSTPEDQSDDIRMVPFLNDSNNNGVFDFRLSNEPGHGSNEPYSDWIYFFLPPDTSPGQAGYNAFFEGTGERGTEHLARVALMNWQRHQGESEPGAGDGPVEAQPETGTIFRINGGDSAPFCKLAGVSGGPPLELLVDADDHIGLASVSIVSAVNATIAFTPPSFGDKHVPVSVLQIDGTMPYSYELELVDTSGYSSICSGPEIEVHNAGEVVLGVQSNSNIGGYPMGDFMFTGYFLSDLGAVWPRGGTSHLYAGNLWVGSEIDGEKKVMDNLYGGSTDWMQTVGTVPSNQPGIADQVIGVSYTDQYMGWATPIGLLVHQQSYQWNDPSRDDFIIFTYDIENVSGSARTDVYPALWLDTDILPDPGNDMAGWDDARGLIYQYGSDALGGHIGLMVLGERPSSASAFPWSFLPNDRRDDEDKYDRFITAPMPPSPPLDAGDTQIMTTAQPFNAEPGAHHTVAIGMVFGANLADLQTHADVMEEIYLTEIAPGEMVENLATQTELSNGQIQSLTKQLHDALEKFSAGKQKQALNKLNAFMHRVDGLVNGRKLTEAQGDALKDVAQDIIDQYAPVGKTATSDTDMDQQGEIDEKMEVLPDEFKLSPNYPNPFNPTTTIRFDVPEASRVSLFVYDMLGRQVANLVDGIIAAGEHTATFDARGLPSGAYVYRLETPAGTFTETMLLLK